MFDENIVNISLQWTLETVFSIEYVVNILSLIRNSKVYILNSRLFFKKLVINKITIIISIVLIDN